MPKARPIARCDKITMEVLKVWRTSREVEEDLGIARGEMTRTCLEKRVSPGKYVYRYLDEVDPNEDYTGRNNRPVFMVDGKDQKTYAFYSIKDAANYIHVCKAQISDRIAKKKPACERYWFKYAR